MERFTRKYPANRLNNEYRYSDREIVNNNVHRWDGGVSSGVALSLEEWKAEFGENGSQRADNARIEYFRDGYYRDPSIMEESFEDTANLLPGWYKRRFTVSSFTNSDIIYHVNARVRASPWLVLVFNCSCKQYQISKPFWCKHMKYIHQSSPAQYGVYVSGSWLI